MTRLKTVVTSTGYVNIVMPAHFIGMLKVEYIEDAVFHYERNNFDFSYLGFGFGPEYPTNNMEDVQQVLNMQKTLMIEHLRKDLENQVKDLCYDDLGTVDNIEDFCKAVEEKAVNLVASYGDPGYCIELAENKYLIADEKDWQAVIAADPVEPLERRAGLACLNVRSFKPFKMNVNWDKITEEAKERTKIL